MSYAEAASSQGPTGSKVVEDPLNLTPNDVKKEASQGADKVKKDANEALKKASKEADKIKKDASKATEDAIKKGKAATDNVKKDLKELEKESRPYIEQATKFVKEKYQAAANFVGSYVNKDTVAAAGNELQNPVVLGQIAVILGGATAGWFVYSERARIRSDNKYVVGIHAAVITGLVLADGVLFSQLYPKYKKN